jgi:hypothetical protein
MKDAPFFGTNSFDLIFPMSMILRIQSYSIILPFNLAILLKRFVCELMRGEEGHPIQ